MPGVLPKADSDQFALAKRNGVLETTGGLSLVDTSYGRFWIPERDLLTLAEMLEEQQRDVYGAGGRGVRAYIIPCVESVVSSRLSSLFQTPLG